MQWFNNLSIRLKVLIVGLLIGTLPLLIVSSLSIYVAQKLAHDNAATKLSAVRDIKAHELENFFHRLAAQIRAHSVSNEIIQATKAFDMALANLDVGSIKINKNKLTARYQYQVDNTEGAPAGSLQRWVGFDETAAALQHLYITNNPAEIGAKEELDDAGDGSIYSQIHAAYHPSIRKYLQEFGYYDIFIVDPVDGRINYSVFKEVDYGTSVTTGPYANTGIGRAAKAAINATDPDFIYLDDFARYEPSYNGGAMFLSSPIYEGDKKIGVLIYQLPVDKLLAITGSREGLGETGEVFVVGEDSTMRSSSPLEGHAQLLDPVSGSLIEHSLAGGEAVEIGENTHGDKVLGAYGEVDILGHTWHMFALQETEELFAEVALLELELGIAALVILLAIVGVALLFARVLSKPVQKLNNAMQKLADGDLNAEAGVNSQDEIGQMAKTFEVFRQNALAKQEADAEREAENARKLEISAKVNTAVKDMSTSIAELSSGNSDLSSRTEAQAANVEETTATMQQITEHVKSSGDQAKRSQELVNQARNSAQDGSAVATEAVAAMGEITASAEKITEIIGVIDEIAFQTNLLALNAAVEAARAGEQGRGFAVVASEVRTLAGRSANAAKEIKEMITESVNKIHLGSEQVRLTGTRLQEIAEQVEEAENAMNQIVEGIQQQVVSINEINEAITQVDSITQQNAALVEEAASASQSLQEQIQQVVETIES